ncbi:hypothetical protein [Streptomyces sp. NPDC056190]|uniref:hypothetical protein n=1 Tax=Streptomyces sp. NPDC056190 TaxID=3345741 RepID=UPI0035E13005
MLSELASLVGARLSALRLPAELPLSLLRVLLPEQRVGRPPVRDAVRLERVELPGGGGGVVVHNYVHGGAGVTVAWGCAREAARLVLGGRAASV